MPSSELTTGPTTSQLVPLTEPVSWLTSTTLHILIGFALGTLAARLMRQRHLRWTWALATFVLFLPAHSVLAGWALTLDTATLCAAVRGRHWHCEDQLAGGDLAEIAAARRGLLTTGRKLASVAPRALRLDAA